jgi:hypothetical protein
MISVLLDDVAEALAAIPALANVPISTSQLREVSTQDFDQLTAAVTLLSWSPQAAGRTRAKTEARVGIYLSRRVDIEADERAILDLAHTVATALIGANVTTPDRQWTCTGADAAPNPDETLSQTNTMKVLIEATILLV